jgi:hypothetical protein
MHVKLLPCVSTHPQGILELSVQAVRRIPPHRNIHVLLKPVNPAVGRPDFREWLDSPDWVRRPAVGQTITIGVHRLGGLGCALRQAMTGFDSRPGRYDPQPQLLCHLLTLASADKPMLHAEAPHTPPPAPPDPKRFSLCILHDPRWQRVPKTHPHDGG